MNLNQRICFILNNEEVDVSAPPGLLLLDFLRNRQQLTGTKEGCKEGDCGACTVILGDLQDTTLTYRPMTSCLMPLGEMQGKHVVTIEGLNMEKLSPVQAAMVQEGGTQCGYCTPGFVVAMTSWLMDATQPLDRSGLMHAISGNLCRCTGYRSIKAAGLQVAQSLRPSINGEDRLQTLCQQGYLPEYFSSIPQRLAALRRKIEQQEQPVQLELSPRFRIAGGTDLYVQKGEDIPDVPVALLNDTPILPAAEADGQIVMDARMTFEAMGDDPLIQRLIPDIRAYNDLIASWPIRTRSTLGGNIVNASPIADMTALLLAMETEIELSNGAQTRWLPLPDLYLGYKTLAKAADEVVTRLRFPRPDVQTRINWEKVSKRAWLDIASVNSAAKLTVMDDVITDAHLSLGGVAPIPLYLEGASSYLRGKRLQPETVWEAVEIAMSEISPISDVRGSADYKRLLARQFLLLHFTRLYPQACPEEVVYAAH